jgi:hypothetical protein
MKRIFFVLFIALAVSANAQQVLTGQGFQTQNQNWSRTGNVGNGSTPINSNIFGTAAGWNSPIYTETFGIIRTRLNGNLIENVNGVNQNLDGFFGIGVNGFFANNAPISMLHLEGLNNTTPIQNGFGWRAWMRTGTFMRENSDAMYVGL